MIALPDNDEEGFPISPSRTLRAAVHNTLWLARLNTLPNQPVSSPPTKENQDEIPLPNR